MKKFYLLIVSIVLITASCNVKTKSNSTTSSKTVSCNHFSKIDAGGVLKINLVKSDTSYINIKQNAEDKRTVNYYVKENTLYISSYTEENTYKNIIFNKNNDEIDVELGVQAIDEISLKNVSSITSNFQLQADNISLELENASSANLDVNCKKIKFNTANASSAEITGNADTVYANCTNASSLNASKLENVFTNVKLSNSSHAKLKTRSTVVADCANVSSVEYTK